MAPKRDNSPPDEQPDPQSAKKHCRKKSLNEIINLKSNALTAQITQAFDQIDKVIAGSILEDSSEFSEFSEKVQELVAENRMKFNELLELQTDNPNDDIAMRSFSRLSVNDYDRLGILDPTKAHKPKSTSNFIDAIAPSLNSDADPVGSYWESHNDKFVKDLQFIYENVNTTSEAACSMLINQILLFVMKQLNTFEASEQSAMIPQLVLSQKSSSPAEVAIFSQTSAPPAKLPDTSLSRPQTRSTSVNIAVRILNTGTQTPKVKRTILTGTVDYGLFIVASEFHQALVREPINIRSIFGPSSTTSISNFLLLEAKRKGLGYQLEQYLPQVIGESLAAMQESRVKHVAWCLTTGYDWIFGVTAAKDDDNGYKCVLLETIQIDFEDKALETMLKRLFRVLVYFAHVSADEVLCTMEA